MLQHLLVAGAEFRLAYGRDYCDFISMADRRARELLADLSVPAEARVFDAVQGTITRYSTGTKVLRIDVPKQEYGSLLDTARYEDAVRDHEPDMWWRGPIYPSTRTLRLDQLDLMSVLDVYEAIWDLGASSPKTLGEVAFFTHGCSDGPQLLGSRHTDGHALGGPNTPMWFPTPGLVRFTAQFAPPHGPVDPAARPDVFDTWRDPCDTDARVTRDVELYSLPPDQARLREAFAPSGHVRVFGGTLAENDFEYLSASIWSRGVTDPGKGSDLVRIETLSPPARTVAALAFTRDPSVTVQGEVITLPRALWRRFLERRMRRCWAAQMATLLGVPVFAPPLGLVATPSTDGYLAVPHDLLTDRMADFAADVLGSAPDPEKRGHLRFDPA